jgi:hypothetical protein
MMKEPDSNTFVCTAGETRFCDGEEKEDLPGRKHFQLTSREVLLAIQLETGRRKHGPGGKPARGPEIRAELAGLFGSDLFYINTSVM